MTDHASIDNTMVKDADSIQTDKLFELDFLLAIKRNAHGFFSDPSLNMIDITLMLVSSGINYPGKISEKLSISGARSTALLNSLADKGLITREPGVPDRRNVICKTTIKGRKRAARLSSEWRTNITNALLSIEHEDFADVMADYISFCLNQGE